MASARPTIARRRPRRGSIERPINTRLVRGAAAALLLPLLLVAFSVARPGPLPRPAVPPTFDGETAVSLARDLIEKNPNRLAGTAGALNAADWYRAKLKLYGLRTRVDRWSARVRGRGDVELRNLVTTIPGKTNRAILFVSHRDNAGRVGSFDNASGTATLIELARAYGTSGATLPGVQPLHTLAFISTDGAALGSLGAQRLAETWPDAYPAVAVVVLDGLGGRAAARVTVSGLFGRSPPPALVRTLTARVGESIGYSPSSTSWLAQLVSLGLGFGYGEQATLLGSGFPAVRLGTAGDTAEGTGMDGAQALNPSTLIALGRAAESTLVSLDQAVGLAGSTRSYVFVGDRALRGWFVAMLLIFLLLPYSVALIDLTVRIRRRGGSFAGPARALRRRAAFWSFALLVVAAASYAGVFPRSPDEPLSVSDPAIADLPVVGLLLVGLALLVGWLVARVRLLPVRTATSEDDLAGQVVALLLVGAAGIAIAIVHPYAIVFLAPSLGAWLWLPQLRNAPAWVRDIVYGAGLMGPVLPLLVLATQLGLGARSPLYALSLLTTGVVPWTLVVALAAWAAAAAQLGAIQSGRYAPARRG